MASISATLSTATLPELKFLSPISTSRSFRFRIPQRSRIKAASGKREDNVVLEERDAELLRKVNGSVNGNGSVKRSVDLNGALLVDKYSNGSVGVIESENGSLMKYVNGNGVAGKSAEKVVEVKAEEVVEKRNKKSIDEIGQEEAWFKKNKEVKVYVLTLYLLLL